MALLLIRFTLCWKLLYISRLVFVHKLVHLYQQHVNYVSVSRLTKPLE